MYFINTRDLLFVTLSLGIAFLVIFLCLLIYQLLQVLKNVEEITKNFVDVSKDASHTSRLLTQGVDALSDKVSKISLFLANLGPIVQEVIKTRQKKNKKK